MVAKRLAGKAGGRGAAARHAEERRCSTNPVRGEESPPLHLIERRVDDEARDRCVMADTP